jgi:hypothetical protein
MLIGAGLLRRPACDILSARPSRLHSCPVSPAQPAASVPGSPAASQMGRGRVSSFLKRAALPTVPPRELLLWGAKFCLSAQAWSTPKLGKTDLLSDIPRMTRDRRRR